MGIPSMMSNARILMKAHVHVSDIDTLQIPIISKQKEIQYLVDNSPILF